MNMVMAKKESVASVLQQTLKFFVELNKAISKARFYDKEAKGFIGMGISKAGELLGNQEGKDLVTSAKTFGRSKVTFQERLKSLSKESWDQFENIPLSLGSIKIHKTGQWFSSGLKSEHYFPSASVETFIYVTPMNQFLLIIVSSIEAVVRAIKESERETDCSNVSEIAQFSKSLGKIAAGISKIKFSENLVVV